jgi:ribosomal protein S12 methylthiotransferase accessory factor
MISASRAPEPIADGAKAHVLGTHRGRAPHETVARLQPLLAQMGITRLADITGLDRIGVPVMMACRPMARSLAISLGKGLDRAAASASALMEAAELYHAEHIELPLKLGSRRDLAARHELAQVERLAQVSDYYHDELALLWVEGRDLVSGRSRWLPLECVSADFTAPPGPGAGCFDNSSNGLASGNSLPEAICHGLCELIERDATTLWQADPQAQAATGLDLASVSDPACRQVIGQVVTAGFDLKVWETTSDIGVAGFFCQIIDLCDARGHVGIGAGVHPSRDIALLRAVTEAVQVRATYISGARDDLQPRDFAAEVMARRAWQAGRLRDAHRPARDFAAVPDRQAASFHDDLDWLLARLRAVGLDEVIAVDLSRSELGLAVVRVAVPGLEGPDDHPCYRPGARAVARARTLAEAP